MKKEEKSQTKWMHKELGSVLNYLNHMRAEPTKQPPAKSWRVSIKDWKSGYLLKQVDVIFKAYLKAFEYTKLDEAKFLSSFIAEKFTLQRFAEQVVKRSQGKNWC